MTKTPHESDVAFIQALAELLNQNDLAELSVKREYAENDSLNVRVSKYSAAPAPAYPMMAPAFAAAPAAPVAASAAAPAVHGGGDPASHPGVLASPMVGTVFLAAEPGAEPFIAIGAQVKEGQTVLIIEAMKTMNHIPAPRAGTVKLNSFSTGGRPKNNKYAARMRSVSVVVSFKSLSAAASAARITNGLFNKYRLWAGTVVVGRSATTRLGSAASNRLIASGKLSRTTGR